MVWNGNSAIATLTTTGGNRPDGDDPRTAINMVDGNDQTSFVTYLPVTIQNSVTVTFKEEIIFDRLEITTRNIIYNQDNYQNVCLLLDGVEADCTAGV